MSEARRIARALMRESAARGDSLGLFEPLYAQANGSAEAIQWTDQVVNPYLQRWLSAHPGGKGRALDVRCGLGDSAAAMAAGYAVAAFDISPTAVAWAQRRFPTVPIDWCVSNVIDLPATWQRAFNFVVEIYTLQVLPPDERRLAMKALASMVAIHGTLLVICRGREPLDPPGEMPWPLTLSELKDLESLGLDGESIEEVFDEEDPPVRRWIVNYRRNA
jgi:SAM-dependent methyltransferase